MRCTSSRPSTNHEEQPHAVPEQIQRERTGDLLQGSRQVGGRADRPPVYGDDDVACLQTRTGCGASIFDAGYDNLAGGILEVRSFKRPRHARYISVAVFRLDAECERPAAAVAQVFHRDLRADWRQADAVAKIGRPGDAMFIHGDNDIAGLKTARAAGESLSTLPTTAP